nr:MAG TPA: large terminase [Caudoviricetes sp.]
MKQFNNQYLTEYYIDFDTPNKSFLKIAAVLYEKGIDNFFFLSLNNKKLQGVDPFDPDLTVDQQFMIFRECAENRWYFYREVFRVSESGASTEVGGGSQFLLNRGNLAYLWAMSLNISAYLIMPRQTGKTWAAIADCVWTHQFVRGSNILHFNKNQSDANMNVRRISDAIKMLPLYMQHSNIDQLDPSEKRRVKNNEKTIRNTINATIEAMASAGNEAKADSMARGKTASKIWWDELAFIFFNEAMYGASTPAYEKAREISEKNQTPYAISITTTPGDLATPHGAFAYKMMEDSIPFQEEMYNWKRKKLYDIIYNTPDKTGFVFIQFSHLQLGETDDWYLDRAKKMNNPIRARREYLLEWINSNGNSPFDPDDIEVIGDLAMQRKGTAEVVKINKYFNMYVYQEYHGRKPVLIGVDVSGGLGRDSTAVVVVHPETLMPIAFFKSNMIPSDQLKKLLITVVTRMYPNCILTIENNSVGKPLIDHLRDTSAGRVLYKERKKKEIDMGVNSFTKKRRKEVLEYGHNTNPTSRMQMMEMLENLVHNSPSHVAFPELYDEIRYMELRNGRIDHSASTHDDCTMAYLGVLWIVRYGTGLKNKGIYWTITEGDEDEIGSGYDTTDSFRAAHRIIINRQSEKSDEDELVDFLSSEQPVETSSSLAARERAEYNRALDEIDGITLDDDPALEAIDAIPDSTQRLLLKNYYSMVNRGSGENILEPMLASSYQSESDNDWSNLYSW